MPDASGNSASWTAMASIIAAFLAAGATFGGIWWKDHKTDEEKAEDGRASVQLARIARDSTDRDQLVGFLRDSVSSLNNRISELEKDLDR